MLRANEILKRSQNQPNFLSVSFLPETIFSKFVQIKSVYSFL